MIKFNFLVLILSAFIPILVGTVWFNPKVIGTIWMKETGVTEEQGKSANMPKIFLITFVLSFFYAMILQFIVIHQFHLQSMLMNQVGFATGEGDAFAIFKTIMEKYGREFRTFKHGAFHGLFFSILAVLPIIGINAMFEMKSWRYIGINVGYWAVVSALMGGIICQFS